MDLVVTALSAIQADLRRQKEAIGTCTALSRTRVISEFMRFAPGTMKSSVMLEGPRHFWLETFPEVVHSENLNMLASRYSSLSSIAIQRRCRLSAVAPAVLEPANISSTTSFSSVSIFMKNAKNKNNIEIAFYNFYLDYFL